MKQEQETAFSYFSYQPVKAFVPSSLVVLQKLKLLLLLFLILILKLITKNTYSYRSRHQPDKGKLGKAVTDLKNRVFPDFQNIVVHQSVYTTLTTS